ncbi:MULTISPECIES: NAD(P)(+) transhydrogenase (Re/Si-specific) subunit beta [Bifidobacterium]|uniref:NAD(P)(+) transhydrogenase (Re/Si-specific) subunit beta n=1 Tax=Bifidobacterium TaxID=1678 RepID=UPI001BDBD0F5|nr:MULTISPECIES: NAD(P)(+) transhydrogenase (Re/Si-specific) subunit beta [Bifidobacterium]MBT1161351.1 NAD(P)(+) transhydrogenase (Re/Si-specific) subunit beta [Bifidobacterium sp. SO1]MBW3078397.1 NAD(P)(+) transhydrogenase (Re/Si-specific) subunit beta [Bifidobacterium simiiventris]
MGTLEQTLGTPLGVVEWFVYLLAAVMFVIGLHLMNSPKTARRGNLISAAGMVMACVMAFIVLFVGEIGNGFQHGVAVVLLIAGIAIGAIAGVWSAKKVKMTDMPQLVSVFNTVGGGAAALVALNDILNSEDAAGPGLVVLITAGLGIMIGSVTFTGSLVAAGKLQGVKFLRKLTLPAKGVWNIAFIALTVIAFVMLCVQPSNAVLWCILTTVFALGYGLVFVIPIGGADMPVVISVLNACTGTAVAMSGLAINNIALIVAGALVGAAGVTLSLAMSKAMNRPLMSVLAGGFGGGSDAAGGAEGPEGTMKETSSDDVAVQLVYADKVIFVPGFGLAQAQAQRELADLGELLKGHGVEVEYAIHPVAGRMPGHMNVLLAEANVPYEELVDLDDINPQFPSANVALVVGANDVTNPAARRPGTPVSGMPILDVDKAQNVVVMKRGRGKGYAGIENELYFKDNTQMLFGDAKAGLQAVIAAVKELIA